MLTYVICLLNMNIPNIPSERNYFLTSPNNTLKSFKELITTIYFVSSK